MSFILLYFCFCKILFFYYDDCFNVYSFTASVSVFANLQKVEQIKKAQSLIISFLSLHRIEAKKWLLNTHGKFFSKISSYRLLLLNSILLKYLEISPFLIWRPLLQADSAVTIGTPMHGIRVTAQSAQRLSTLIRRLLSRFNPWAHWARWCSEGSETERAEHSDLDTSFLCLYIRPTSLR